MSRYLTKTVAFDEDEAVSVLRASAIVLPGFGSYTVNIHFAFKNV